MATTKLQHREWLETLAGQYKIPLANVADKTLDLCVDWGIMQVFNLIFAGRKELFHRSGAVAQDGAYPANHFAWARAASYTFSAKIRPMRYCSIPELPHAKKNTRVKNFDENPIIYFHDQQVHYLPVGIATATYEYYVYPVSLAGTGVTDATDDGMPADCKEIIGRCAFEKLLMLLQSEKNALGLLDQDIDNMKQAQAQLYDDVFNASEPNPRRN